MATTTSLKAKATGLPVVCAKGDALLAGLEDRRAAMHDADHGAGWNVGGALVIRIDRWRRLLHKTRVLVRCPK